MRYTETGAANISTAALLQSSRASILFRMCSTPLLSITRAMLATVAIAEEPSSAVVLTVVLVGESSGPNFEFDDHLPNFGAGEIEGDG